MFYITCLFVYNPDKPNANVVSLFSFLQDKHDTGAKINTVKHKAFMAKRRWKVNEI